MLEYIRPAPWDSATGTTWARPAEPKAAGGRGGRSPRPQAAASPSSLVERFHGSPAAAAGRPGALPKSGSEREQVARGNTGSHRLDSRSPRGQQGLLDAAPKSLRHGAVQRRGAPSGYSEGGVDGWRESGDGSDQPVPASSGSFLLQGRKASLCPRGASLAGMLAGELGNPLGARRALGALDRLLPIAS